MRRRKCHSRIARSKGFTLVELVMVVTIIGTISAIAVPRMSGAAADSTRNALEATLSGVRTAIDCYYAEHGRYPGYDPATGLASNTHFPDQLIKYSSAGGQTNASYSSTYKYGPYLRSPFPKNPFNKLPTVHVKSNPSAADPAGGSVGWVAVLSHGYFGISAGDADLEVVGIETVKAKSQVRALY